MALGTTHGYALVDNVANRGLLAKSTLNTCSEYMFNDPFDSQPMAMHWWIPWPTRGYWQRARSIPAVSMFNQYSASD